MRLIFRIQRLEIPVHVETVSTKLIEYASNTPKKDLDNPEMVVKLSYRDAVTFAKSLVKFIWGLSKSRSLDGDAPPFEEIELPLKPKGKVQ